jgi:hypothetical protein
VLHTTHSFLKSIDTFSSSPTLMSSSWLLQRCASPAAARVRASAAPYASMSVLNSSLSSCSASSRSPRSRLAGQKPSPLAVSSSPLLFQPLALPLGGALSHNRMSPVLAIQARRFYSRGRNPWQSGGDWKSTLKTGGLILLGTGALVASTSCRSAAVNVGRFLVLRLMVLCCVVQWPLD